MANGEGFDTWWKGFNSHYIYDQQGREDVDFPCIDPWVMRKIDQYGNKYYERNAYFFKVALKEEAPSLYGRRANANEQHVTGKHFDLTHPFGMAWRDGGQFRPGWGEGGPAREWRRWYESDGEYGEEPSAEMKEIYGLIEQWLQLTLKTPESNRIGTEILARNVRNLYRIGTVGMAPQPVIIKNGLMNVPEVDAWHPGGLWFMNTIPEQWFWKK